MAPRPISLILPTALVVAWEVSARSGAIDAEAFSMPSEIVAAGWGTTVSGEIFVATWQTLESVIYGMILASVIGISLGIFLGFQPFAEKVSRTMLEVLRSIPAIAFMPLALLILGFGLQMEAVIVAYACVWPILISAMAAARNIEPRLLEVADVLEMGQVRRLVSIVLPAVFSRIMVGIRTALGFALVVAITVEILSNPRGLGYGLVIAQQTFQPALMYAYLIWLALLGLAINEVSKLGAALAERGA